MYRRRKDPGEKRVGQRDKRQERRGWDIGEKRVGSKKGEGRTQGPCTEEGRTQERRG